MDFTSISPVLGGKKLSDRELSRALRIAIAAEHDATHLYELMADSIDDVKTKKLFQDIANEEKVHVGEFQAILQKLDKKDKELVDEGVGEAMKKTANFEDVTKKAFQEEIEKIAALDEDDVENYLGIVLKEKQLMRAKEMANDANMKSFILRHPILTGIPTLGLAPLVARGSALDRISKILMRTDNDIMRRAIAERNRVEDLYARSNVNNYNYNYDY